MTIAPPIVVRLFEPISLIFPEAGANIPPGARHRIDNDANERSITWHGTRSFIADLSRLGRKVARIVRRLSFPPHPRTEPLWAGRILQLRDPPFIEWPVYVNSGRQPSGTRPPRAAFPSFRRGISMYVICLASDYDGTLAHDGAVDPATVEALERLKRSGRKLLLVTGRELPDLVAVCPRLDLFNRVAAENGAVH